jgi:hypothetical protein
MRYGRRLLFLDSFHWIISRIVFLLGVGVGDRWALYIYIYIYIFVCVCVCARARACVKNLSALIPWPCHHLIIWTMCEFSYCLLNRPAFVDMSTETSLKL